MRDDNFFFGRGKVSSLQDAVTSDGVDCASFLLLMESDGYKSWVRVNAYGEVARYVKSRMVNDSLVLLRGNLMNRRAKGGLALTEIRCKYIELVDSDSV